MDLFTLIIVLGALSVVGTIVWWALVAFGFFKLVKYAAQESTTGSFQGFLGEIWEIWKRDAARAVLLARWNWQNLPEGLVAKVAAMEQCVATAKRERDVTTLVDTRLGSMGIFPGSSGGSSFGLGMDPDQAMFTWVMGLIRANGGDPPPMGSDVAPQTAEAALRGFVDPIDAMIAGAPPATREQMAVGVQLLRGMGAEKLLRLIATVEVACALPRVRIPVLIPEVTHIGETVPSVSSSSEHLLPH